MRLLLLSWPYHRQVACGSLLSAVSTSAAPTFQSLHCRNHSECPTLGPRVSSVRQRQVSAAGSHKLKPQHVHERANERSIARFLSACVGAIGDHISHGGLAQLLSIQMYSIAPACY